MKKRYLFPLLFLSLVLGVGYWAYNYFQKSSLVGIESINAVPSSAVFVLETDEPIENWQTIAESEPWLFLQTNPFFKEVTAGAQSIDSLIVQNSTIFGDFGSRDVVLSAHMISPSNYDFLYILDLGNTAKLKPILLEYLNKLPGYKISNKTYKEQELYKLLDTESKESLYLTIWQNLLLCSYTSSLVEEAINEQLDSAIITDFIDIQDEIKGDDMFRVYLNYQNIEDYIKVYLDEPNSYVSDISQSLKYSGLSFDYNDKETLLELQGITSLVSDSKSYWDLVHKVGSSYLGFPKVVPQYAATVTSLNIDDFEEFYVGVESLLKQDEKAYKEYKDNINKVEKFLNISMQKNFVSWVGKELCFVQTQPIGLGRDNEMAFFIHTNSISDAVKNLDFIGKQIKKRTPVKFKKIEYNNHQIKFLSVKGMFKLLMGKYFGKIEKPYYTVIDDYVIFSNHPQTLKNIIDDYENGATLANSEAFKNIKDNWNKKSSVFLYVNTPIAYDGLKGFTDSKSTKGVIENRKFIEAFPHFAMQLVSDGEGFETKILMDYESTEKVKEGLDLASLDKKEKQTKGSRTALELTAEDGSDSIIVSIKKLEEVSLLEIEEIVLDDLDAKMQIEKYESGKKKISVGIKDGLKHGLYLEYSEAGKIIVKGRYRKDRKVGVWRSYDENGDLLKKKRF